MGITKERATAYADFLEERVGFITSVTGHICPTHEDQLGEIKGAIDELSFLSEYITLDIVRILLDALVKGGEIAAELYNVLYELIQADKKGIHLVSVFLMNRRIALMDVKER